MSSLKLMNISQPNLAQDDSCHCSGNMMTIVAMTTNTKSCNHPGWCFIQRVSPCARVWHAALRCAFLHLLHLHLALGKLSEQVFGD